MHLTITYWIDRLREAYPHAVAILLKGSYARGEASAWSDIDFDVLVSDEEVEEYRTWIEPVGERLVHISVAVEWVTGWERDSADPSSWSYGLPTQETTQLLWAADENIRRRLDRPFKVHPAAEPEVEDTVEALGKIRNAMVRGDDLAVYQAAQVVGKLIPTLLVPINPPTYARFAREAIDRILAFPNVPEGFAADWLTCMGLVDRRTHDPQPTRPNEWCAARSRFCRRMRTSSVRISRGCWKQDWYLRISART
uniref:Aminoglycoside-4'-adenyltransferase n=1 Tax=Pseudomonas aeruginosa TaxID=287 RepID=Q04455_PSEAI|nr:aminoglycoside nucleotidyltransferase ANT(4')-IIa [Pseudomonas aeruginosa]AAA25717.1 aminoglycoside-4'-adenyltransferase [Pseudomonas aeruginosa]